MRQHSEIKRLLAVTLKCAVVGMALLTGQAFAADAAKPPADLILKGDAKCTGCHDEADDSKPTMLDLHPSVLAIGKTRHGVKADGRTPTCTDCHGASEKHLTYKGSDKPPKPDINFVKGSTTPAVAKSEACLSCHQQDAKRSHWEGSAHQTKDVACTSCHQIHTANDKVRDKKTQPEVCYTCHKEQRIQMSKPSRHPVPEGKMACSDCHNSHGSVGPKLMKRDSVVETCYTCHMEKRGPFVHNHEPVSEDCGNCHNPHGTVVENLLKVRAPFLCHQCHTPHGGFIPQLLGSQAVPNAASMTGKSTTNLTQGRSCMNCHTQVHGTNNPATTNPTPQFNFR
jgi:DmsE family decaheme c-type cytochrome